jgi:DNA-binding XRE family transcriptional regulator
MVMLEPRQLRAARALVGWSRQMLADKSGVPRATIEQIRGWEDGPQTGDSSQAEAGA